MIDLEERFRADVQQLPQTVPLDLGIDVDVLLASGHQLRRCRIVRRAASGVAVVVTVGLLSYGVIANRTIAGVPAPAQTASVPTETAAVAPPSVPPPPSTPREVRKGSGGPIVFDLSRFGIVNGAKADFHGLRIDAVPDATGMAVDLVATTTDGTQVERKGHSDGSSPVLLKLGPRTWAGVVPDAVVAMHWRGEGDFSPNFRQMSGAATAIVVTSDTPIDSIGGYVWRTEDGEYRDSTGNAVPSTVFTLEGRSYWFFDDAALDFECEGLVQPDPADGPSACSYGTARGSSIWRGAGGDAVAPGDPESEQDSYLIGVLPEGASKADITLADDASEVDKRRLTVNGRIAFLAYGRSRDENPTLISRVTYLDASGNEVIVVR